MRFPGIRPQKGRISTPSSSEGTPITSERSQAPTANDTCGSAVKDAYTQEIAGALQRLNAGAPVSATHTLRAHELPYQNPPVMNRTPLGETLSLDELDPAKKYLFVLNARNTLVLAPETQPGFAKSEAHPEGRIVTHGDLNPMADGQGRAPARAGGNFYFKDGAWKMDLDSSYCFNRTDGKIMPNPQRLLDLLEQTGHLPKGEVQPGPKVYNHLSAAAGKALRVLHSLGLRKDPA